MNKMTDLGFSHVNKDKRKVHLFKCYCGKEKLIPLRNIVNGWTKSCGCIRNEAAQTHGLKYHRLYSTYIGMHRRCYNSKDSNYHNYGGRGIEVCKRWHNIHNFIEDMYPSYKEGLSIDRINNNKGYSHKNCRWATQKQQARNFRRNVRYKGECIAEFAERTGMKQGTIVMRIRRGATLKEAFTNQLNIR